MLTLLVESSDYSHICRVMCVYYSIMLSLLMIIPINIVKISFPLAYSWLLISTNKWFSCCWGKHVHCASLAQAKIQLWKTHYVMDIVKRHAFLSYISDRDIDKLIKDNDRKDFEKI